MRGSISNKTKSLAVDSAKSGATSVEGTKGPGSTPGTPHSTCTELNEKSGPKCVAYAGVEVNPIENNVANENTINVTRPMLMPELMTTL